MTQTFPRLEIAKTTKSNVQFTSHCICYILYIQVIRVFQYYNLSVKFIYKKEIHNFWGEN